MRNRWLAILCTLAVTLLSTAARADKSIETAVRALASLPVAEQQSTLVAHLSQVGHWTLRNHAGETMTAATPDELQQALRTVGTDRHRLILTEATLSHIQQQPLPALARLDKLTVATEIGLRTLVRPAPRDPLHLVYRPNLFVALTEPAALALADRLLARRIPAQLRSLRLQAGGPSVIASTPRSEPPKAASQASPVPRSLTDTIDPLALATALGQTPRQMFYLNGRLEGGTLTTASGWGLASQRLVLEALIEPILAHDLVLVVAGMSSAAQPSADSVVSAHLARLNNGTLADLIEALMDPQSSGRRPAKIAFEPLANGRGLAMVVKPLTASNGDTALADVSRTVADWGRQLVGVAPARELRILMPAPERLQELDRRVVGWLPAWFQWATAGLLLVGLIGAPVSWQWFGNAWPVETSADYATGLGFGLAKAIRILIYGGLFMPLAGPFALVTRIGALIVGRAHPGQPQPVVQIRET